MTALVIGAGPAGLMAAEVMALGGLVVTVVDAMPSPGRKFLMAGKSGLNLTKDEDLAAFLAAFGKDLPDALRDSLMTFGPAKVMDWARGLGQPVFTGTSGRVFPQTMKASPLLRAWMQRLTQHHVTLQRRWRWSGWNTAGHACFDTPDGPQTLDPKVTVLALGGASWRRLGSDGAWAARFGDQVAPFQPTNMGLTVTWSAHMAPHFGQPVKGGMLRAGELATRGEFVVSSKGLEGGGIYGLSTALRANAPLSLDLFPDLSLADLRSRLARPRGKESLATYLRKVLRLEGVRAALLQEFGRPLPADLAPLLKSLPLRHAGPRPIDEAISVAGGLRFDALDQDLMLRDRPGVFCAGEMLDWEAPTGGYLINACLATGRTAGLGALRFSGQ